MKLGRQTTVRDRIDLAGLGVHSGANANLSLHPASSDTGIVFQRTGDGRERIVRVSTDAVSATDLATVLGDDSGPVVATVEHLVATLMALGVDNVICEIDGAEIPILDGSAAAFVEAIQAVGLRTLSAPRRFIKVLKPVRVSLGRGWGELRPYSRGLRVEVEIDFPNPCIGRQAYAADITPEVFANDLARARTFGFMSDVTKLWSNGYARGASLDNTIVVAEDRVLNTEGLRFADEFARHKALDAVGDLGLAGAPLLGQFRSYCGGHRLNFSVVRALLSDKTAWCWVDSTGVRAPVAVERRSAGRGAALAMPAFRADQG